MAAVPITLIYQPAKTYTVGAISFDLLISESHNMNNTITSHKVQDGSDITDHIQNELENGSLSGLVSNYSIKQPFNLINRAQSAFDAMYALWKSRTLITIVTVLKVYKNVAIISIEASRDSNTGEAQPFTIAFKAVKTVTLKANSADTAIKVGNMDNDLNRSIAPKADMSKQTPDNASISYADAIATKNTGLR